jgi:hypothetical protein
VSRLEDVKDLATYVHGLRLDWDGAGSWKKVLDPVALETPVNIYVNGEHFVTLFATPSNLVELGMVIFSVRGLLRLWTKSVSWWLREPT